jgi:methyl-accepting chemotaxis protein
MQVAQSLQSRIPTVAHELEMACKDVESQFIKIGDELQTAYGDAIILAQKVQDTVNLIGDEDGSGVLSQMRRLAEGSLRRLEGCRKDISEKTARAKTLQEKLDALFTIFLQVEKAGRFLRIVAVNVGIESARSNESTELFSAVASDSAKLSKKIKSVSQDGQDVMKEVRDVVQVLYGDLYEGLRKITGMGRNAHGIVREAAREIEIMMASMLQIAEQAGEHAGEVSQQVGNLVMAVQFHDSMSQRVEHITKALGDVEALLIEGASGKLSFALYIMKLQAAQLKKIIDEIGRVYEKCAQSFEEIIKTLSALLNHLEDLSTSVEPDADRKRGIDSFERLRLSLCKLDGVLHQGQALMDPVRDATSRASETAAQVNGLIQDIHTIGFESRLMALNAIVKAARLGSEGGALEVLAQEVKHSSNQSTSIMEKADELLVRVTVEATKLQDQDTSAEADVSLENSITEMSREYDRFIEESAVAHRQGHGIRASVSKAKAGLDFLPLLAERLTGSLNHLEAMIRELVPFASEDHSMKQVEVDDLLKRYTMNKERVIHKATLFGITDEEETEENQDSGDKAPESEYTTGNKGDLGGNVELF